VLDILAIIAGMACARLQIHLPGTEPSCPGVV
jgi:hypothetical protein